MSFTLTWSGNQTLGSGTFVFPLTQGGTKASTDVITYVVVNFAGIINGVGTWSGTVYVNGTQLNTLGGSNFVPIPGLPSQYPKSVLPGPLTQLNAWGPNSISLKGVATGSATFTFTNITVNVTTATDSVGNGPVSPGGTNSYRAVWITVPPNGGTSNTAYTATMDVYGRTTAANFVSEGRMTGESGTVVWKLWHIGTSAYVGFKYNGGTTSTSQTVTVTDGRATGTVTIPSGSPSGLYRLEASNLSSRSVQTAYSTNFNIDALPAQSFLIAGVPSAAQVNDNLGSITCTAKSTSLATITTYTGTVTVVAYRNGVQVGNTVFLGTKSVAAVAGVATFSTLSFAEPGNYYLEFSATGFAKVQSNTIAVTGAFSPDDIIGLRQDLLYDGTVWRLTTNITSPTLNTPTETQRRTIDGDMASTSGITTHGVRYFLPFNIKLQRVDFKVQLSSISSTPTIRLYTSQDATSVSTGTWVQQAEFTPVHINRFISAFSFATPVACRGVWMTLNQNGGAATATWYSIQVVGPYLNPSLSFTEQGGGEQLANESSLVVPSPAQVLSGAQTVTRSVTLKNNTSTDYEVAPTVQAARLGGDSVCDSTNLFLLDESDLPFPEIITLPAYSSRLAKLQYVITATENDSSGKHYIRFTPFVRDEVHGYFMHMGNTGANQGIQIKDMNTWGTFSTVSQSAGSATYRDCAYSPTANTHHFLGDDGSSNVVLGRIIGEVAATWTITGATVANVSRMCFYNGNFYIFDSVNTAAKILPWISTNNSIAYGSITSPFSLPTQTTGPKCALSREDGSGRLWVMNGSLTSNIVIYDIDVNGQVFNTISTVTALSGKTIQTIGWDLIRKELYVITALSGGSRTVARYSGVDGSFIASTTNSDRNTIEATGCMVVNGKVYILYGSRFLWRYTVQTMASGTEVSDVTGGVTTGSGTLKFCNAQALT